LEAGATWTNPKDGAVYLWIPPGEFTMGSSDKDKLASNDEKPPHPVYVDGFWIMRTEVTNAQYKRCVEDGVCTEPNNPYWKDTQSAVHPVTDVSWHQATDYATWVEGRLPTEAEWEKACRGTDGRIYPWGNQEPLVQFLNFGLSGKGHTMLVRSYQPGANGLYDMAGNVWEWTADWYDPTYYTNSPLSNPKGPEEARGGRTLRGGSWITSVVNDVRCAARLWDIPDFGDDSVGFRVVFSGF
jgi:formylglycine-generating enzyme required for sulfatase activity